MTGWWCAPEAMIRLFTVFEQADNSITRKYGGSGLGLAITRKLSRLMGGDAGARSTLGQGSSFWFTALLRREHTPQAQALPDTNSAEAALSARHGGSRILLVEDEPINREVSLALLADTGLEVDVAEDGLEAVALANENPYAVILMDMQMPHLDGLEATRQIRQLASHRNTPIIAMTANAFAEDKSRCLDAGMDDYISKPVNPDTLFAKLLLWLEQSSSPGGQG